jgi:leucyl/phenylalanyl-tRNA---protein transferase
MPVYQLSDDLIFPAAEHANSDGLLAIGGDLSPARLLLAYERGIFPWYNKNEPILWWSPDPRFILHLDKLHISKSMKKLLKKNVYQITFDTAFEDVVKNCSTIKRTHQKGTWITKEMITAYKNLHDMGAAHSAEAWCNGELCGGIYGVSLGGCFFGESMFSKKDNASKFAIIKLIEKLKKNKFAILDCQIYSDHLKSLGAEEVPRTEFLQTLKTELLKKSIHGSWTNF